ncbi:hypothetical protein WJ64_00015 [Burkholderia ubonensis]|nr:hypothetical protein WJ64_00015 [Burkholderia ubonensis]
MTGIFHGNRTVVVVGGARQRQALEQPGQVTIRIDAIGLACFDERIEIGARVRAVDGVREQPSAASNAKLAFILPISGRKLKSIIVGIHCMVAASRFET